MKERLRIMEWHDLCHALAWFMYRSQS
jgi:hypothetical protein